MKKTNPIVAASNITAITLQGKSVVNAYGVHTHKNSKTVYCITNGDIIVSMSDTAVKYNISKSALSKAISSKKPVKGMFFCYAKDLPEYIEEISKSTREKTKVYNEVTAMRRANEELEAAKAKRDKYFAKYTTANQLVAQAEARVNELKANNIWKN